MLVHFSRREYRCQPGLHRPGRGGSTPPSCRVRVASIAAMQRSLKPQSTGQHRGDPPFRRCGSAATAVPPLRRDKLPGTLPHESASLSIGSITASVVKLLSSSASNGEFAGGSPAGCTNSCRVSPTTRGAPLRTERLGVELPHAAPFWNVHRPSAPGLFARQCVPPGKWCESTAFRNFRKDDGRMQNAEAPGCR